jgi:hypothetical protein
MNEAMGKRTVYTKISPLPSHIPRQLALDMLHSHSEMIKINPLVTGVKAIDAPRDAAADEFFAQWYEITEIITWGFGFKKKIAFKGVFYDLPNGLQTHTYAPMGVDLRNKWTVRGNQPGEPKEPRELGVETPLEGLYLREDVEIECNYALTGFVKKEMKAAANVMVDRLTRKAELLTDGEMHAMFENGQLKTSKPNAYNQNMLSPESPGLKSPAMYSPGLSPKHASSEYTDTQYTTYRDLVNRRESRRSSNYLPAYQKEGYQGPEDHNHANVGAEKTSYVPHDAQSSTGPVEVEGSLYYPQQPQIQPTSSSGPTFHAELADTSIPSTEPEASRPAPLRPRRSMQQQQTPSPQPSPAALEDEEPGPPLPPRNNSRPTPSSPQPSPGLANRNSMQHPAHRSSSASYTRSDIPNNQAAKRESAGSSTYAVTNPDEGFYSRNSSQRTASTADRGLADRVRGLGIEEREEAQQVDPSQFGATALSKCPVCANFEGDEAAVNHHVEKHFA